MTENEIMDGLRKVKEKFPNATIGMALEQIMELDGFHFDNYPLGGSIITANIPVNCKFNKEDVAGAVGLTCSLIREGRILIGGSNDNYGKYTEQQLLRLSSPGSFEHIEGADDETWRILSSIYVINV